MQMLELLRAVADACEQLRLKYYVTGSVASSYYGTYRSTEDVDVVVELPSWNVREFCALFPDPTWYVDDTVAAEAVRFAGMFNIIHNPSGLKIDIIAVKEAGYHELRLDRARAVMAYGDKPICFSTPEDVILSKLEFFRDGQSPKHIRDISRMFEISGSCIDRAYIELWAPRIGVSREWCMMKEQLGLPDVPPGTSA